MYTYTALIIDVIDGDTVIADVDLGFGVWLRKLHLRLAGINAPELRGADKSLGLKAKMRLADLCLHRSCPIDTHKGTEKYGRWLATITVSEGIVNDILVAEGLAKPWDGKGQRP